MPTYEYCCIACGYDFEALQRFEDEPLTICPQCGNPLRKVFNSVGIVFKGSGFYSTDNHTSAKPRADKVLTEAGEKAKPAEPKPEPVAAKHDPAPE